MLIAFLRPFDILHVLIAFLHPFDVFHILKKFPGFLSIPAKGQQNFLRPGHHANQILRRVTGHQPSLGNNKNVITDCIDFRQNMGAEDHRVILPQPADQITDLDDLFRIKTYRGLIQNNNLRVAKDCLRQSDSLSVTF